MCSPPSKGGLAALERCDVVVKMLGLSRYRPELRTWKAWQTAGGGLGLWLADRQSTRAASSA